MLGMELLAAPMKCVLDVGRNSLFIQKYSTCQATGCCLKDPKSIASLVGTTKLQISSTCMTFSQTFLNFVHS